MNRADTIITVTIIRPGFGRYKGGGYITGQAFRGEKQARDYYTDCLVRYPDAEVTIEKR